MPAHQETLTVRTSGRRLYEITHEVAAAVERSGVTNGLCVVFCTHTSASLLIQENAAPEVQSDLLAFLDRLVPEGAGWTHDDEGPDDMPSHVKAALGRTSETIPVAKGRLALGTWQGIYLWEHRTSP
ncbi:MAG TPA: secondary thiamine-phosphate synthase enzyme YjbQ, partial [Thermoanaerobaculia bacterium]|nr:secondary thiamine-phosphate synthase enzyme YjbQ [Thermoanaerobaculia bacterium]